MVGLLGALGYGASGFMEGLASADERRRNALAEEEARNKMAGMEALGRAFGDPMYGGAPPAPGSGYYVPPRSPFPDASPRNIMPPDFGKGEGPGIGGGGGGGDGDVPAWAGTVVPGAGGAFAGKPVATPEGFGPQGPMPAPYIEAVKRLEGYTPRAQWDYKQYSSGYGTRAAPGETIDRQTADSRLQDELWQAAKAIDQRFPGLPQNVKSALTSFTFNLGPGWMQGSNLARAVEAGDFNAAQNIMQQYVRAGGKVEPGLVSRRQEEAGWIGGREPTSIPAGAAYAQGGGAGGPPRFDAGAAARGEGFLDLPTLAARVRERNPNLTPSAMYHALQLGVPMLNLEGKAQIAALRDEYNQKLLDFKYTHLSETEAGKGARATQAEEGRMTRAELRAETEAEKEKGRNARLERRGELAQDLEKLKQAGKLDVVNLTGQQKKDLAEMGWDERKQLRAIIGDQAMDRLTRQLEAQADRLATTEAGKAERLATTEAGKGERLATTETGKTERLATTETGKTERLATTEAGKAERLATTEAGKGERQQTAITARSDLERQRQEGRAELEAQRQAGRIDYQTLGQKGREELARMNWEEKRAMFGEAEANKMERLLQTEAGRQVRASVRQEEIKRHNLLLEQKWGVGPEGNAPEDRLARAGWTPDVIDQEARTYIATGREPRNLGTRELAGMVSAAVKTRAKEIREKEGISLDQMQQNWAKNKALSTNIRQFDTGPIGNTVRSFNVLVHHLGILEDVTTALDNRDTKLVNRLSQIYKEQTGNPAPTNFDAVKAIVGDELVKAILGGANALGDRQEIKAAIDRSNSPDQLLQAINQYKGLALGQLNGLEKQYRQATQRSDFNDLLLPTTRKALEAGAAAPSSQQPPPSQGWGPSQRVQ